MGTHPSDVRRTKPPSGDAQAIADALTKPQAAAVLVMLSAPVTWSPGDIPGNNAGRVRKVTLRNLKALGVAESYGLHEWGPYPVYAAKLTDGLGREVAALLSAPVVPSEPRLVAGPWGLLCTDPPMLLDEPAPAPSEGRHPASQCRVAPVSTTDAEELSGPVQAAYAPSEPVFEAALWDFRDRMRRYASDLEAYSRALGNPLLDWADEIDDLMRKHSKDAPAQRSEPGPEFVGLAVAEVIHGR